ncbi:MAG: hypothetical protein Q9227_008840 [Pyrenula ochraceoflavens]
MLSVFIAASLVLPTALAFPFHARTLQCLLVWDGRVPLNANGSDFDAGNLPYNPSYDLGAGLTWSSVLSFPNVSESSVFDTNLTKAVEISITDASIFTPSPDNAQTGFRRAELLAEPSNTEGSVTGIKTLHFSIMSDMARPLNYSHEYQLVWLESADYSADQFTVGTGTLFGDTASSGAPVLFVRGTSAASPQETLWQTTFTGNIWHNFGLELDFDANTLQVLYSTGEDPLASVTTATADNLSGMGEYHFGILKKPTGEGLTDITKQGYQESGINEGLTYGGIFLEDSADGCVSLMP